MRKREQRIRELVETDGLGRKEAELRLQDDLWLLHPVLRAGLEGQQAVEEWQEARAFASALNHGFGWSGPGQPNMAIAHLVCDLEERAEEAVRQAKERADS